MSRSGGGLNIDLVAAARPNFMKVAPLFHALSCEPWCDVRLVHTGQHYDANMSEAFLRDLQLPPPQVHLGVGSGTHAQQTANVMVAYEEACNHSRPDLIVVVGDVNSTLACALVGAKHQIPVAHLEAGLRSNDRSMPEEINRVATDAVADILWTPSPDADQNLLHEGVPRQKITRVGNIMMDSYELLRERIQNSGLRERMDLGATTYGVVTLHRPANVDNEQTLAGLLAGLCRVAKELPLVFPMHPRTRKNLQCFNMWPITGDQIRVSEPLGYIDFMSLVSGARLVITDSGGIQEETTYLGIPCLTLRNTTERPITISEGTNRLVTADDLVPAVYSATHGPSHRGKKPELWDGRTARRIVADIKHRLLSGVVESSDGTCRNAGRLLDIPLSG